nr:restriction endonuclease subunit S [Marinobacter goseongensis]
MGAVPKHWSLKRLGHFFSERREKVSDKDFQPLSVTKHGIVPRLETAAKTQDGDNRKRVIAGDFVINSRSDRKGSSGLSELDGSVSLICIVLEPNGVYGRFAHHLLRSEVFQEEFYRNGKGIVADLWSTGFSEMKNIVIPVPSHHEQTQIARFLDHETAKIDALIREQERLIELLQEKRQAVISHAVTKGLDPDVPMKDSGVEWLGEVPAHWRVGKLRWYATIQGGVAKGKDYQDQKTVSLPYLRVANVQAGYVDLTEVKEIAVLESEIERYSLRHGDVLMNEGGDNDKLGRGTVWRAEIEPCLHQNHVFAIRPNGHLTPEWLAMFTQSSRARSYFFLNSKQSTNLASISSSNVMNLDLPMPSVDEQERILQFLESELQQFTDLQKQADKGIQLLLERRSALISAAVTGKIDVRNWQPPVDESAFDEDVRQAGMEVTA